MENMTNSEPVKYKNDKKKSKKRIIVLSTVVGVLVAVFIACAIYVNDYYHADYNAMNDFIVVKNFDVKKLDDDTMIFEPENPEVGFIFYPGGKVEYTSYKPLMEACATKGILCVLVEMPFNLAVLDIDAAEGMQEMYPDIEHWYIGGHSLGGSMAASYASDNLDDYDGLILLGAYSTANLSQSDLKVLSVYGSEDKVLNKEKYDTNKSNLPADYKEYIIEGGCHAYFGMYGNQDGDGTPTLSNSEQILITTEKIAEFVGEP